MDLGLYGQVLWRFRKLVFGGVLCAILLAILSVAKTHVQRPGLPQARGLAEHVHGPAHAARVPVGTRHASLLGGRRGLPVRRPDAVVQPDRSVLPVRE